MRNTEAFFHFLVLRFQWLQGYKTFQVNFNSKNLGESNGSHLYPIKIKPNNQDLQQCSYFYVKPGK